MKNLLREFFRPIDNFLFNYFVKIGGIQSFIPAIIGGIKALAASGIGKAAIGLGKNYLKNKALGAISGKLLGSGRGAGGGAAMMGSQNLFRNPSDYVSGLYDEGGFYSKEMQDKMFGADEYMLGKGMDLQETRTRRATDFMRGLADEQADRQLGILQDEGDEIRATLEDPRLRQIADADLATAERLTREAQGPLGFEAARRADQQALGLSSRLGRIGDSSAIARAVLGREDARQMREQAAAAARQGALQSAVSAQVDPFKFRFGSVPSGTDIAKSFLGKTPGLMVSDPSQFVNLGLKQDALGVERDLELQKARALKGAGRSGVLGTALDAGVKFFQSGGFNSGNSLGTLGSTDLAGSNNPIGGGMYS